MFLVFHGLLYHSLTNDLETGSLLGAVNQSARQSLRMFAQHTVKSCLVADILIEGEVPYFGILIDSTPVSCACWHSTDIGKTNCWWRVCMLCIIFDTLLVPHKPALQVALTLHCVIAILAVEGIWIYWMLRGFGSLYLFEESSQGLDLFRL